jgi:hypothetical protein
VLLSIDFEKIVSQEYKNQVRRKEQDISQLQKSLIRDSMRVSFFELGKIHYSFGYLSEAVTSWIRAFDFANTDEDQYEISYTIA